MEITTAWVGPPTSIGGLDHLGSQAPCILIYGQLLPGITNVTDRARYYSFYPWLIWSLDKRYPEADEAGFVDRFRRADCLFTLVAEHHSQCTNRLTERHGAAMVGRQKLVGAVQRVIAGQTLQLSAYASHEPDKRYFQNRMGGLSQYYAGTLAELGLLGKLKKPWFQYTKEVATPLAEAFNAVVPADAFWEVLERGDVDASHLHRLHAFCPCHLANTDSDERSRLCDIYFDPYGQYGEEGAQRKRSLALIQHLIKSQPSERAVDEQVFRASAYSGALYDGRAWQIPLELTTTREIWAEYVRNDLLSVAVQAIFSLCLRKLAPQTAGQRRIFHTVEQFAANFKTEQETMTLLRTAASDTFNDWLTSIAAKLPEKTQWTAPNHEISLAARIVSSWESAGDTQLLELTMQLLAILVIRDDSARVPYYRVAISKHALHDYPINLHSFQSKSAGWRALPLDEVVRDLAAWCMNTHLRVSLRKLHRTGDASFRFRPSERGLCLTDGIIPVPSQTTPRFRQAFQILMDIGAVVRNGDGSTSLTMLGSQHMEAASV